MSTFALKMVAIITMFIDHMGAIFFDNDPLLYPIMRGIGRLAFPIFIFLIVEGFHHTRDVKKYLTRLGLFAIISEIPFDLAFYKTMFYWDYQNVFFTLFLGLLLISLMKHVEEKYKKEVVLTNIFNGLLTIGFCIIALFLRTDYSYLGILLITAFYLFRGSNALLGISIFIVLGYLNVDPLSGLVATLAIIFIRFYSGKKGKDIKYFFYVFYPAHLLIFYLLSLLV